MKFHSGVDNISGWCQPETALVQFKNMHVLVYGVEYYQD